MNENGAFYFQFKYKDNFSCNPEYLVKMIIAKMFKVHILKPNSSQCTDTYWYEIAASITQGLCN